jgi:hypothetical protein
VNGKGIVVEKSKMDAGELVDRVSWGKIWRVAGGSGVRRGGCVVGEMVTEVGVVVG